MARKKSSRSYRYAKFLEAGLEVARKQRNLLVSAEKFSYLGKDNMMELKDYLAPWSDIFIVSTIATFSAGLVLSTTKNDKESTSSRIPKHSIHVTGSQFVKTSMKIGTNFNRGASANVIKRAKEVFDNVIVLNMHDKSMGDAIESLSKVEL